MLVRSICTAYGADRPHDLAYPLPNPTKVTRGSVERIRQQGPTCPKPSTMDGVTARKAVLVGRVAGVLRFAALLARRGVMSPLDDGRYSPGGEMFGVGAEQIERHRIEHQCAHTAVRLRRLPPNPP